jgi:hypothetical protein
MDKGFCPVFRAYRLALVPLQYLLVALDCFRTAGKSDAIHFIAQIKNEWSYVCTFTPLNGRRQGKGKGEVHPRTGHEAQRGSRSIAVLFL